MHFAINSTFTLTNLIWATFLYPTYEKILSSISTGMSSSCRVKVSEWVSADVTSPFPNDSWPLFDIATEFVNCVECASAMGWLCVNCWCFVDGLGLLGAKAPIAFKVALATPTTTVRVAILVVVSVALAATASNVKSSGATETIPLPEGPVMVVVICRVLTILLLYVLVTFICDGKVYVYLCRVAKLFFCKLKERPTNKYKSVRLKWTENNKMLIKFAHSRVKWNEKADIRYSSRYIE